MKRLVEALPEKPQVLPAAEGRQPAQHAEDYLANGGIADKTLVA